MVSFPEKYIDPNYYCARRLYKNPLPSKKISKTLFDNLKNHRSSPYFDVTKYV